MKKLLVPFVILFVVFCTSCSNQQSGMSDRAKKNLETATAVAKMFESHDWSKTGDYIAADAVDHSGPRGEVKGLDNIKAEFNEDVFQWMKESWTQTKDEMGMKAGSKMNMDAIEVSKFNSEGKITDHWSFISMNDMMKMMQMPQGNMSMDTSKMKMDTTKH